MTLQTKLIRCMPIKNLETMGRPDGSRNNRTKTGNRSTLDKGNVNSTYDGSSSSKPEATSSKYEPAYSRSGSSEIKRTSDGSSSNLRLGQKYSSYSSGYQRDASASRDAGKYPGNNSLSTRLKETTDKKDTSHPPISYRPIARTGGSLSRDPSAERDSTINYSRLYPPSYGTRSVSRERTDSTSSASTIPKYTGRSSTSKDDKYTLGRTSRNTSREDLSSSSKFKTATASRAASREDLTTIPNKYITSRFLPKNTIEKSHTAYTRPSSTRIASSQRETSRKNRELLNLLSTQNDTVKTSSRPDSRCSSNLSEDTSKDKTSSSDMQRPENINSTPSQTTLIKAKTNTSRLPEKQVVQTNNKNSHTDDKSDTNKSNKCGNSSATPWSNYLDLKFSSPGNDTKNQKNSGSNDSSQTESSKQKQSQHSNSSSPKNLSRNNSSKSLSQNTKLNSKPSQSIPKPLPPQIPNFMIPNKDFRKSVLNMNPDGKSKKSQRSNSVSSAESEVEIPLSEATDISENLSSCKSFHKTSSSSISKLPKRTNSEATDSRSRRSNTRSPSVPSEGNSSSAAATSGSEDDSKSKSSKSKSDNKQKKRNLVSTRNSTDDSILDKSPKPPISPRPKNDNLKSEAEAKSFLMRALAPVTSLFKVKYNDAPDKINWLDSSSENTSENKEIIRSKSQPPDDKIKIRHIESGERAWWMEQNQENSESCSGKEGQKRMMCRIESGEKARWLEENSSKSEEMSQRKILRRVESGEKAWWLDDNAQIPEGIIVYATEEEINSLRNSPKKFEEQKKILRRVESGERPWWLDENGEVPEGVQVYSVVNKPPEENIMTQEYLQKHKIRHIDSGERAWWLCSSENIPELINNNKEEIKNVHKISHQRSGEKAWWLGDSKENSRDTSDTEGENEIPLGDRASPEGLEMPKESEQGRLTPYDNVPSTQMKPKRPDSLFISRHKNIDDILGGVSQCWSPLMDRIFSYQENKFLDNECEVVNPDQVKIHDSTAQRGIIQPNRVDVIGGFSNTTSNGNRHAYLGGNTNTDVPSLYSAYISSLIAGPRNLWVDWI
ncbi:hypothetical protein ILUMI_08427 [Ignelater luminosus]|uniref:Uncharacterized protein n=1 Tax=Ignelater luminosus TaxID=2038154 RepID=A0A8K0GFF1_IGNLU|nr:hypothetical protein ILUMI_08427 [Ignelater luminosus]